METNSTPRKWYKKWWGVMIISLAVLFLALLLAGLAMTLRYWQLIRAGHGDYLHERFYGSTELSAAEAAAIKKIRLAVETTDDPYLGKKEGADIVIVEFIDFKCPVCREQDADIKKIVNENSDRIKLIVRDFPVELTHPGTSQLAAYASCAHAQGLYWPVHDYLFSHQDDWGEELAAADIAKLNDNFGLNQESMSRCLADGTGRIETSQDYASGLQNGLKRGTPTFFINGYVVAGMVPYEKWQEWLAGLN